MFLLFATPHENIILLLATTKYHIAKTNALKYPSIWNEI